MNFKIIKNISDQSFICLSFKFIYLFIYLFYVLLKIKELTVWDCNTLDSKKPF